MLPLILALTLVQVPVPLSSIQVTASTTINIDLAKLKGKFVRKLAWSPDASELYLMTYDANKDASIKKEYHFTIRLENGAPKAVEAAPAWAEAYWAWKAGQASPDDPATLIDPSEETRRVSAVATPFGGDLARGGTEGSATGSGGGLSTESAVHAANVSGKTVVRTMRLKGQVIGEWFDHPIVPGETYGWAPKGAGLIAYRDQKSGRLMLMNLAGEKRPVEGTKDVSRPAWSNDGSRLAYLEGRGRNRFALVVATVQK